MSTVAAPARPVASTTSLASLARIEATRYAKHPLYIVGIALAIWALVSVSNDRNVDLLSNGLFVVAAIGLLGYVVAYRLTRSMHRSVDVMNSAPVSITTRTAALCLACLVPALTGFVLALSLLVMAQRVPGEVYLQFTDLPNQFVLLVGHTTIACLGGPLLGVATARWLRFPGAVVIGFVVLIAVAILSYAPVESGFDRNQFMASLLHAAPPYTLFTTSSNQFGEISFDEYLAVLYPGSTWWYMAWQLSLCGLAVIAALLKDATPVVRSRLVRVGVGVGIIAIASLLLTASFGAESKIRFNPDGTSEAYFGLTGTD